MNLIVLDLETVNREGKSDFRWWKPGFSILSIALAWRDGDKIQTWFSMDRAGIVQALTKLAATGLPIVVHNLAFEMGVIETLFPHLKLNWFSDTMRLGQLYDNGGDWRDQVFVGDELDAEESPDLGLKLEALASRVLKKDLHNHKTERDEFLRGLGIRSKFGSHIHRLPPDILRRYNEADTTIALELYEVLASHLDGVWQKDWVLYYNRTRLMAGAYRRGIKADVPALERYAHVIDQEIDAIEAPFRATLATEIRTWASQTENTPQDFNCGSNKQLKELFCGVMGLVGRHTTKKGETLLRKKEISFDEAVRQYPSFQAKHLGDWGEAGRILIQRKKRLLVLSQDLSALEMAKMGQGRIHPEQKIAGTRTNRVSGGHNE